MVEIYLRLLATRKNIKDLCLATVIGTRGSTPQKPGSSAIFSKGRLIAGTVGGGIVEGRTQEASIACSETGKSRLLKYQLDNDISEKEGAICGGEIEILIDANPLLHERVFDNIRKSAEKREKGILITMITAFDADQVLVNRYWMTEEVKPEIPPELIESILPAASRILNSGDQFMFERIVASVPGEEPSHTILLEKISPRPKLVIAGAGHIGKALSHLGRMTGFEVTVIDERADFANRTNIPDADNIIVKDIGTAISELPKGRDTYIVIVTRGHSKDAEALKACIGSAAAYVGMIGSKLKVARIKTEFLKNNWASEEQWSKIHSPVGIDINSKTVEEIAISIIAELILEKNKVRN